MRLSLPDIFRKSAQSVASIGKCAIMSRPPSPGSRRENDRPLIIMGNGPSLRHVLDNDRDSLLTHDLMAVNFAANTPEFFELRPKYYVLADPHFFTGTDTDPNVARLWDALGRTHWEMTMFVPCLRKREFEARYAMRMRDAGVKVKWFNLTPVEGLPAISHFLFRHGLGMPRPRNVLIASIMLALREGYRDIYITGADHTWSRSLWVDDRNRVVSVQPHFYKDRPDELDRVAREYAGYHLHDILNSLTIAFRSYFDIARYAASVGASIVNATPGSMIDAFPRGTLPAPKT
ncbi:MAG: hypothetical protein K2O24_02950 [Muribaculaceae bacterium]|nr:hypothetical protein [Muribaculaceae bacterium]